MAASAQDLQNLINDISAAAKLIANVGSVLPASYQSQKTGNLLSGKVFEAWVLLKLGVALATELTARSGGALTFTAAWSDPPQAGGGTRIIATQQREAPWVASPPVSLPHVQVKIGNIAIFEIYNSIRLPGHSTVKHEADIVVRNVMNWPLLTHRLPLPLLAPFVSPHSWLWMTPPPHVAVVELKFHSDPISLGLLRQTALMRLDVALDGPPANQLSCTKVARSSPTSQAKVVDLASYHGFATYSSPSAEALQLADHYNVDCLVGIGSEITGGAGHTIADLANALLDWNPA